MKLQLEKVQLLKIVLSSGSKIASGAVLENVIIDKHAKVEKKLELKGTETSPLYIKEGDRV